ncbi:pseudouridine synthase [Thermosediminibacter litoriperuensis]|uniref:Pseudouridine synthase n=1 Tax=Thermosediminibacter litoriperuensis TaxID=291989 RepID=A0A5S5AXH3_9FIRM|nr:pseudouridine synthase [Thermosediminibacter litoriperuensis]TYP56160.1 ribosomal small subunit pseudouridine synthase A [Thermosediminibacter litoriperuensis]
MAGKTERLDKVLSMSGYGSRKDVKKIIKRGEVEVNGRVVTDAGAPVDPAVDSISVYGEPLIFKEYIYIMMNKPKGVISATHDRRETTVIDLLEDEFSHRNLFPVGRLDKDAEGLLLLTDDGQLAHRLLSPRKKVEKVYYVEVKGRLVEEDVRAFQEGIFLGDYRAFPAKLEILEAGEVSSALITVYEGKFHQIKRMMKARGKEVTYLKRLSMGPLKLDEDLNPGEWRELTGEEIRRLL